MQKRKLGRTGLCVSPIALGGASFGYVHKAAGWDPYADNGRRLAIDTINHAIDRGVDYIDTAPLYGNGNSETLIGDVIKTRRKECVLATKVWFEHDRRKVIDSVHESLKRLQTDYIDIVQVHGRMYSNADYEHIVHGGPLDGLRQIREAGKIGFIGITTEEPWTVIQFLAHKEFDLFQIAYNFICQAAARHFLIEAAKADAAGGHAQAQGGARRGDPGSPPRHHRHAASPLRSVESSLHVRQSIRGRPRFARDGSISLMEAR